MLIVNDINNILQSVKKKKTSSMYRIFFHIIELIFLNLSL